MEHRELGTTGIQVSVVSFGTWALGGWMWGGTDDVLGVRAVQRGIDEGITCIDTAPIYGMGHSESIVGKAIRGRREKTIIATKCGLRWDLAEGRYFFDSTTDDGTAVKIYKNLRPASIRFECDQSLKRLAVDVIDLYQSHWPDSTTPIADTMGAMLDLQREGKIRAFGVSNLTAPMLAECLKSGPIASHQVQYNLLQRDIEADVAPICIEHGIGLLAYSPIAQGLLTGKVSLTREFPEGDVRRSNPWFKPENRQRVLAMLSKIKRIAADHGVTLAQVAINWVISQEGVTSAFVGARNEAQVVENAKASQFKLREDEDATIRRLAEELGGPL